MFETEGVSHIAMVNTSATLISADSNPGDISGGPETIENLDYEFADDEYKWNTQRDLKTHEPVFSSGDYSGFFESIGGAKKALIVGLKAQKEILHAHETDDDTIQKAHKFGVGTLLYPMYALNYDELKGIFDELTNDQTEVGKLQSNIFTELLGSTGTTAAALLVKDLLKQNKFDNERDASRTLSSIPFHIRRPNEQLVEEFKELLDMDFERTVDMAVPLFFGHLVRITCERAGRGDLKDPEFLACAKSLGNKWINHFWDKFNSANNRENKNMYLSTISNIRYGGASELLKPLIYGESSELSEFRSSAIWAVLWEVSMKRDVFNYYFPVFAERSNPHEVRMSAAFAIMHNNPSSTEIARIVNILSVEKDYEIINGIFSLLESKANSISPCDRKVKQAASFFLKYLKQFSKYETEYGFGVTKSYSRQFHKKKYGYGGSYMYYVTGSTRLYNSIVARHGYQQFRSQ